MTINRRGFIQSLGACTAGLGLGSALGAGLAPSEAQGAPTTEHPDEGPVLQVGDSIAVAETRHGKVRGFILNGVHCFRGIPYGADTSGANRFQPPRKPETWAGVKPALWWGNSAPQDMTGRYANATASFVDHWNYDEVSEDCLRINIWTPALADGRRRPVLVWLHGGGFVNGNGIEQDGYDGENLARQGDLVFCSVNHRLGPIGFSNFAGAAGVSFAQSGNVGMLDLVAALEWVRDNISHFGGDPGNVTIMGQSGGGAKVCLLLAMPSAKGLFHKAVALSGTTLSGQPKDYSEKLGSYVLAEAGLKATEMDKLQAMPWKDYLVVANKAARKLAMEQPSGAGMRGGFSPVADGVVLPEGRFFSDRNGLSSEIPLLVCSTFNEASPSRDEASLEQISLAEVKQRLADPGNRWNPLFGQGAEQISKAVDAYAAQFPSMKPVEIWSLILSNRRGAVAAAEAKSQQSAPVYVAWFGFHPSLMDGRMRAFHCSDISFWFANTDRMYTHTGGGARPRRLSAKMSTALVHFMRTGQPEGKDLPAWPAFTPAKGETMILNDQCLVQDDPDGPARRSLPAL